MKTHLRRLLMCCLLLLILPMAAFAEENELPVEWVRYGYGLPNPASVDAHGLTEEAITLEGVAYAPKLENGRVYVRLEDLAAAKLVRENGDALQTLGLAVSDLQIENGQLKAPGKEEALARFLSTAGVGVSLNDSFTLANAGEGKLIIRIAGFAAKDSTDAAPAAGDGEVAVEAKGASHLDPYEDSTIPRPSVTTVHVYYVGATSYPVDSAAPGDNQEQPPLSRVTVSTFLIGVAYSQEDLDNGVSYYLTLDSEDPSSALSFDIRDENHTSLAPGATYKALDAAEKSTNAAYNDTSMNVRDTAKKRARCSPPSAFPRIPTERTSSRTSASRIRPRRVRNSWSRARTAIPTPKIRRRVIITTRIGTKGVPLPTRRTASPRSRRTRVTPRTSSSRFGTWSM